jgi:hypothetical protein
MEFHLAHVGTLIWICEPADATRQPGRARGHPNNRHKSSIVDNLRAAADRPFMADRCPTRSAKPDPQRSFDGFQSGHSNFIFDGRALR